MSWVDIWNELKIIGLYLIVSILFIVIMFLCFEQGQNKVHNWEEETGRYGEGLY